MWKKIKNILIIIGSGLAVILLTVLCAFMCRSKADQQGSTTADERDSRIQEGLGNARTTADRCAERLRRAEEILRGAIERSKETESQI